MVRIEFRNLSFAKNSSADMSLRLNAFITMTLTFL
jgi:hypothetical protein